MLLQTAAWATPVVVAAVSAPLAAASQHGRLRIELVTTGLGANGHDFSLRDGKFNNNSTNTDPANTIAVVTTFRVVDELTGLPVSGATVQVYGDDVKDGEGNYVIGAVGMDVTSVLPESPVARSASGLTDGAGLFKVKIPTATYSQATCAAPGIPRTGTLFVSVSATNYEDETWPFSYRVFDGSPLVTCPVS